MSVIGEAIRPKLPEGVRLRDWADKGIVNIIRDSGDLTADDVTALRAALAEAGYDEVRSWIATEGASWLSDGVRSVSIEIAPRP